MDLAEDAKIRNWAVAKPKNKREMGLWMGE
jgi:hypothetical protein